MIKTVSDSYNRRARLYPILLVVLPLGLTTLAWSPGGILGWNITWGLIVWAGGTALLTQLGRDLGKQKENHLFEIWEGIPTTRLLRHRDAPNKEILKRRYSKLMELIPGLNIPSSDEERDEPKRADEIYDSCTRFLINKTRDKKKFPLIFEENCNYGFRRNLWGLKPLGLIISSISVLAILFLLFNSITSDIEIRPILLICGVINLLLVFVWIFWIRPSWVKITADAYAERLLDACDKL